MNFQNLFEAIQRGAPEGYVRRDGFNGGTTAVDLAHPADHVEAEGKLVLNDNGQIDLTRCIAYQLHLAANGGDVNANTLNIAMPHIANWVTVWTICRIAHAAGVTINVRASDVVTDNAILNAIGDQAMMNLAMSMESILLGDNEYSAVALANSKMALMAAVAVCIHREQNERHSWFTRDTKNESTLTGKTVSIAGQNKVAFADFMANHGHDVWHFLSDASLEGLALALCNKADTEATVIGNIDYKGENVNGQDLHNIFELPESVTDRYPPGMLGKAAILTGMDCMRGMLLSIGSRVKIDNMGILAAALQITRDQYASVDTDHVAIMGLRATLGPVICHAYGFVSADPEHDGTTMQALKNLCGNFKSDARAGKELYRTVAGLAVHEGAVTDSINAALAGMRVAMADVAAISGNNVTAATQADYGVTVKDPNEGQLSQAEMFKFMADAAGAGRNP